MEALNNLITSIDQYTGGIILVIMLAGIGIYFTIRLGGIQFLKLGRALKMMFGGVFNKKDGEHGGLSSFQALATAVAAQVGTGNVGGVATAIAAGGPGAVFWMWLTALLGMATNFSEAVLAQVFREKKDGEYVGGPAYYITKGMGKKNPGLAKFLAGFFSVAIILALGFSGNMVQSNSIAQSLNAAFGIPLWLVGLFLAVIAAFIFIGGVKRIGKFAETVVPLMAVLYIIASIVMLFIFRNHIGAAFAAIFKGAFSVQAAAGGFAGAVVKKAIQMGVQRGLFSNEAGMGSTPHAHAVGMVNHPAEQGLMAMCGVFVDTIVICSCTAISIIASEAYKIPGLESVAVTMKAFDEGFGPMGGRFVSICLMFFAFTTIIGWYYFGESNVKYLFGSKALTPYRILVVICILLGSVAKVDLVWNLNGFLNNLMVYPNVIALLVLSPIVSKVYKDYKRCVKAGKVEFDYDHPEKLM